VSRSCNVTANLPIVLTFFANLWRPNCVQWVAPIGFCFIAGCTASKPTSITLYHPENKLTRTCAVRDISGRNVEALSSAVEACAKQLESRGFIRVDRLPNDAKPTPKGATIP